MVSVSHRAQDTVGELLRAGLVVGLRFWEADPHSSQPQLSHPCCWEGVQRESERRHWCLAGR